MLRRAFILAAIGRDRPGMVDRLAGVVYQSGCNLEDSRMAVLGGEFALIVLITGGDEELARLQRALPGVAQELELTVQFKETVAGPEARQGKSPFLPYRLRAVSIDQPGIVHKVTHVLSAHGINVARLDASLTPAPITGAPVFTLEIEAEVPASVPVATLRAQLAKLAQAENIDLELRAPP